MQIAKAIPGKEQCSCECCELSREREAQIRREHAEQVAALSSRHAKTEARLEARLEVLQGVRGVSSTLRRQAEKIAKISRRNAELEAELSKFKSRARRDRQKQYGKSSEKRSVADKPKRKRGAQPGHGGRSRTARDDLPKVEDRQSFPEVPRCDECGECYCFNGTADTERREIEVKAYTRTIKRDRWQRSCGCDSQPASVTAEAPAQLIAGAEYGTSIWSDYLYQRFSLNHTVCGISRWFASVGMTISKGTLLQHDSKFLALFSPIYQAIGEYQKLARSVHVDETGWLLSSSESASSKYWCWGCATEDSVRFSVDPKRSAAAGLKLLCGFDKVEVLVCDRFSSYGPISRALGVELAYCWVHARRDFVNAQRGDKKLGRWSEAWVRRIGKLYWLNKRRLRYYDSDVELSAQDGLYEKADKRLADELNEFFALAKRQLEAVSCDSPKHEGLSRLVKFEKGLRVFADRPWVSMDNNLIERSLRPMVTVRKMSYGSKTEAAAALIGCMESVFATLRMNGIDERKWLKGYLLACAEAGGAPSDLEPWLPWGTWSMPP